MTCCPVEIRNKISLCVRVKIHTFGDWHEFCECKYYRRLVITRDFLGYGNKGRNIPAFHRYLSRWRFLYWMCWFFWNKIVQLQNVSVWPLKLYMHGNRPRHFNEFLQLLTYMSRCFLMPYQPLSWMWSELSLRATGIHK